jgi:hypothetical protein
VSELVPFPLNGNRQAKATGRDLAQVACGRAVGLAVIDQEADLNAARVEAVAYVGVRAMPTGKACRCSTSPTCGRS